MAEGALDETSRKILRLLQSEPDLTVAEIGERVGLSHTPCWRRIKEMEKQGVIRGRVIAVDPKRVGFEVSVFCFVRLKQHDEEMLLEFERAVKDMPEVVQCYSMTGDHDYAAGADEQRAAIRGDIEEGAAQAAGRRLRQFQLRPRRIEEHASRAALSKIGWLCAKRPALRMPS